MECSYRTLPQNWVCPQACSTRSMPLFAPFSRACIRTRYRVEYLHGEKRWPQKKGRLGFRTCPDLAAAPRADPSGDGRRTGDSAADGERLGGRDLPAKGGLVHPAEPGRGKGRFQIRSGRNGRRILKRCKYLPPANVLNESHGQASSLPGILSLCLAYTVPCTTQGTP